MADNSPQLPRDPVKEIELFAEVSQLLTRFDMNRVLGKIIRLIATAVGADRVNLALHSDYDLDWRQIFQTDQLNVDTIFSASVGELETGLAGWVANSRQGTIVYDRATDKRLAVFESDLGTAQSAVAVPFISSGELMAVLTLSHQESGHFTDHHLHLAQTAANQAAVAIRNARLENHVLAQQRQLEAVLHAIEDMVLVVDKNGKVLLMNMAVVRFLHLSKARMRATWQLAELAQEDSVFERVREIVNTITGDASNWHFKARSDQHKRDFEVLMSIWDNPLQGISGYVAVLHDVTTLIDLDRFKNEMLKMASHDLRSPLSLISGYCEMIEMDMGDSPPPNLRKYLDVIKRTATRMDNILNDLLRVEKVQGSPLELHQKVDVLPILNGILQFGQEAAAQKHQKIESDFQNIPEGIMADPALIREAMENLVSNAVKYTPDEGHIVIRAYGEAKRFTFIVEDNGIGISVEHIPNLFKSFYRVKKPGTEHISGTGLGLSLVKAIVERHHGEVGVESETDKGSKFRFWLPLA
jgi:two-component system, OmpR family, phosphate regulon sensor histidine kinase PhoR